MPIYSVFLDKDKYYGKNMKLGIHTINNLADVIRVYLKTAENIDSIYIAGGCYGRKSNIAGITKLIHECFGNGKGKKYNISLMRKYKGFSYYPTNYVIKKFHKYLGVMFDTRKSDHRKMMFFLSENRVMAVLIGSSNYSPSTYLKNSSSEADLLLIDYKHNGSNEINETFIHLLENQFTERSILKEENNIISNLIVSKSLNDNNLLQEVFESLKDSTMLDELNI